MSQLRLYHVDYPSTPSATALPLVILHGLMGNADNWRAHARQWSAARRVIALDLRNHGRSPHAEGMQYASMAEDVLYTLSALGIERCDLLGHSMGGKVAMSLAAAAPERIRRLIVADIAPVAYPQDSHDAILAAMEEVAARRPVKRSEADALMARYVEDIVTRQFLSTNLCTLHDGRLHWRINLPALKRGYHDIAQAPVIGHPFEGKVLLLCGSASNYVRPEHRVLIMTCFPQARIVRLKHCAHWLHIEQFAVFVDGVNRFLAL